jgi:hypothetical protein
MVKKVARIQLKSSNLSAMTDSSVKYWTDVAHGDSASSWSQGKIATRRLYLSPTRVIPHLQGLFSSLHQHTKSLRHFVRYIDQIASGKISSSKNSCVTKFRRRDKELEAEFYNIDAYLA